EHVVRLLAAVSCCMLFVVTSIQISTTFSDSGGQYLPYTPFAETNVTTATRAVNSVANALILIAVIVTMTVLIVSLYYFRFYKVIKGWIFLASCLLLYGSTAAFVHQICLIYNVPMDYISVALFIWNFGTLGMVVIQSKGPLVVQQGYLIVESAFMALVFIKYVPEWTLWVLLCVIPIWDLIAVLCVVGPLKILVETAKERNEGLQPGLIFATVVAGGFAGMASRKGSGPQRGSIDTPREEEPEGSRDEPRKEAVQDDSLSDSFSDPVEEKSGVKMGLGDFVFYSILVGKVATYGDLNVVAACFIAVLVGICVTLLLLSMLRVALPALPVSLALGLLFAFPQELIHEFMQPFLEQQIHV
ncbi:seven trans-membrane protein, putative, partial [Ixodes scapularis]